MSDTSDEPRIYLLPNLMTAGNLCCGFFAVLTIFNGMQEPDFTAAFPFYEKAILLIFGSCLFDLLDGRLARMGAKNLPLAKNLTRSPMLFPLAWHLPCSFLKPCSSTYQAR